MNLDLYEFFQYFFGLCVAYLLLAFFVISTHREMQHHYDSGNVAVAHVEDLHWFFTPAELFWYCLRKCGLFFWNIVAPPKK